MKAVAKLSLALIIFFISFLFISFKGSRNESNKIVFPYKKAGLTERQAAAHLLSRFTYGAKPGQVDEVVAMGLEEWFLQQLRADMADDNLNERLKEYDALKMTDSQIVNIFAKPAQVLRMAVRDGVINKDSISKADKAAYRDLLVNYMTQKGMKPEKELFRQLFNQKILRANYTNNQLQEVLTEFWFNHFNVSITKNDCAEYILSFERDVIRPNVLGKFEDLLLATAKSPAMLFYLDNFSSSGTNKSIDSPGRELLVKRLQDQMKNDPGDSAIIKRLNNFKNQKKAGGLNENYAREVMELHTLGVDGGYTQADVTMAARVLTGWTIYPMIDYGPQAAIRKVIDKIGEERLKEQGFVHENDFLFAANRHDNGTKVVLGKTFNDEGYKEGVELLKMLAHHPSTANFISKKIAVRFVSDNPPASLVNKMAKTFQDKDGDIRQVLLTMVSSPEFWSKSAIREKTKSPFELAISSIRSLQADIKMPFPLYTWIDKMGQKLYYYQAPTGFPDKGQYWINTGALLNRMNFGLALASQRIAGVKVDLLTLNKGHEPESAEAALLTFGKIMMPERDLAQSISRLTPLLNDPLLQQKVENKANKDIVARQPGVPEGENESMNMQNSEWKKGAATNKFASVTNNKVNTNLLSQVVGIIVGSPEFQRR